MSWPHVVLGVGSILVGTLLLLQLLGVVPNRFVTGAARPVFAAAGLMLVLNGLLQCYTGLTD